MSIPWTSADASDYRDRDHIEYTNHLNHGFVPADREDRVPSPEVQQAAAARNSQLGMGPPLSNETTSVSNTDLAVTAMSALLQSPGNPSSSGTITELETLSTEGDFSTTPTVGSSDAAWTSVELMPNQEPSPSTVYQQNTNRELTPVTFVPVNPLQPSGTGRQKRGPFQNDQLREETNKTRQLKACLRCRMQKTRVSAVFVVAAKHANVRISVRLMMMTLLEPA